MSCAVLKTTTCIPNTHTTPPQDEATVRSMSRTGARRELLKGPFLYGSVIVGATPLHWRRLTAVCMIAGVRGCVRGVSIDRDMPPSMIPRPLPTSPLQIPNHHQALAISCLCSGDGAADLVGRRFGGKAPAPASAQSRHRPYLSPGRIPWCPQKSWAGTGGFVLCAAVTSLGFVRLFQAQGWACPLSGMDLWARVLGTTLASAAAETLPVAEGWDNLVVFAAALLADRALCRRRGLEL